jgi:hypothetical protein
VSFLWDDPSKADGRRNGLKGFYHTMNNLFRITLNPKDNATDLNGYITNVLSRFPDGERFHVSRFIWVELAYAMDDERRSLPYAPYLMFMIERVTGQRFLKDYFHTVYNIKKTHGGRGGSGTTAYHSLEVYLLLIEIFQSPLGVVERGRARSLLRWLNG